MRVFLISTCLLVFLSSVAFGLDIYTSNGMQITFYVPHNASNCARSIEGCVATSRPGLDGASVPRSLDDVRAGRAKYVTLASCPNNYGKYYNLGDITYKSAEDGQIHKVKDVIGYVHDTGGDFPNGYNRKGVHGCKKLDINTTICRWCTSDSQAGALASGRNVSFVPNGKGAADPTAFYTSGIPGLSSSYGGLGSSPSGYYPASAPVSVPASSGASYPLPGPIPMSNLLSSTSLNASEGVSETQAQSQLVSELLLALAAPTSSVGSFSAGMPLLRTERIGLENASGLSTVSASSAASTVPLPPAAELQSTNTFGVGYQSPDLRWSGWSAMSFFQPLFLQIEALIRDLIDLIRRL